MSLEELTLAIETIKRISTQSGQEIDEYDLVFRNIHQSFNVHDIRVDHGTNEIILEG